MLGIDQLLAAIRDAVPGAWKETDNKLASNEDGTWIHVIIRWE